ncbi:hypothetical protein J6590_089224 [Homalodisca vitripennis]|nr:hypothetical protein J6590_089224 [Homalodisca vitripennis]
MSARAASLYSAAGPQECRATSVGGLFARCGTALMSAILHNIVALCSRGCGHTVVYYLQLVIISDFNNGSKRPFYIGDKKYSAEILRDIDHLTFKSSLSSPSMIGYNSNTGR